MDASDTEIWKYAKQYGYSIVTFYSDYYDMSIVKGCPPKIVWLRIGNATTKRIAERMEESKEQLKIFVSDTEYKGLSCLEID